MIVMLPEYGNKRNKHYVDIDKLNDDSIIIDVGACVGTVIEALREYKQTAKCKIIALECNKKLVEILRKQNFNNIEICEKALTGQNAGKYVTFFEGKRGPNWGSIESASLNERWEESPGKYKVKTLKINDIFDEFDIDKIDYMKMDIEGGEKLILDTMSTETAMKIKQWTMEVHWPNPYSGITMEGTESRLIDLGFKIVRKDRTEIFCERDE